MNQTLPATAASSLRCNTTPSTRERKLRSRIRFWPPLLTRRGGSADETELRDRREPAEGRHHCRWIAAGNRSASTIWTGREASGPEATSAWAALGDRLQAHRATRARGGLHPPPRPRRFRGGATPERSRPRGRRKSMTPRWPSFPQGSVQDRPQHPPGEGKSHLRPSGAPKRCITAVRDEVKVLAHLHSPQSGLPVEGPGGTAVISG